MCAYIFVFGLFLARQVVADLRMASHPSQGYTLQDFGGDPERPGTHKFVTENIATKYMEPSGFGYRGLENEKVGQKYNNYDQFLRSNIDNEQDNRDFKNEAGMDHLPFRTLSTEVATTYASGRGGKGGSGSKEVDLRVTKKAGDSMLVPFRWNNPHAAELEVNIWIFPTNGRPVVVPIRKPTCSGEGYQDNIIRFTVPADFSQLGKKIPGFTGCNAQTKPMCVVQIYAHSVESRTYATAFPIVITGHDESQTTSSTDQIKPVTDDPGLDLKGLRDLCLSSSDPNADIEKALPRWARLVSDQYNHAYQNSDFSPYSGQQHESISKNLQASCINKMVTGDRGQLGKGAVPSDAKKMIERLQTLEGKIYKNYEALANKIIARIGSEMESTGTVVAHGTTQHLANCFRCVDVGSTNPKRQTTNTYIPSFQLPQRLQKKASLSVPSKYASLISSTGQVQIYVAALNDLLPFFFVARPYGIMYQTAMLKTTLATKADAFQYKVKETKKSIVHPAAVEAKKEFASSHGCPANCLYCESGYRPLTKHKNAKATCMTGKCSKCKALFGNYETAIPPPITALAWQISKSGLRGGPDIGGIAVYPDVDGSPRIGRPRRPGEELIPPVEEGSWQFPTTPTPMPPTGPSPPPRPSPAPTPKPSPPSPRKPPRLSPVPTPKPSPPSPRTRRRSSSRRRRRGGRRRRRRRARSKQ